MRPELVDRLRAELAGRPRAASAVRAGKRLARRVVALASAPKPAPAADPVEVELLRAEVRSLRMALDTLAAKVDRLDRD
jgi:hypothetical protein